MTRRRMHPEQSSSRVDESATASDRLFPEGFTLAVAVILGAVIVLAGLMVWQPGRWITADDESASAAPPADAPSTSPPTTPSTTTPSTTAPGSDDAEATTGTTGPGSGPPAIPGCPSGTDPVICEAVAFVEGVRGRSFQTFPTVEFLADAEFEQALLQDFDAVRDEIDAQGVTFQGLGLLAAEVSLADAFRDALEVGVVGFYDPATDRLVVRAGADGAGGALGLYQQQVLVHELVHAFDDQWFGLDREFPDDEASYGFAAVVEGNARRIDQLWRTQLAPEDQLRLQQEELALLGPADLLRYFSLPSVLQQLQISPYRDGAVYVEWLVGQGGEAAVDAALVSPPTTSEEILEPGLSRTDDPEIIVGPPQAGGELVDEGRLGQLLVRIWLGPSAADGWGGSRFSSWRDGDRSCAIVHLAADSPADLAEMRTAGERWAAAAPADRSVGDGSAADGPTLVLSGCTG